MLIQNQEVQLKWHPRNKDRLVNLGYTFTKIGDVVNVNIQDVSCGSKAFVSVICDYCGKTYRKRYKDYFAQHTNDKDCCEQCAKYKMIATNQLKYGGNSPACSEEVKRKIKKSVFEKYGVEYTSQLQTTKDKVIETCLKKYGVEHAAQNEQIKQKIKTTCQQLYGGNSSQCDPDVRKKTLETMLSNGTIATSKAERNTIELLKEIYGEDNCFPQYLFDRIVFDCLLIVDGVKIDVEYDGSYFHKDKMKDMKRDYFTTTNGFKVLRFKGDYKTPTKQQIVNAVNYLLTTEHHHINIDI